MDRRDSQCPYVAGNTIKLYLKIKGEELATDAEVIRLFEPFTLSSAMVVRIACSSLAREGDMVLKLFDRQFATQLQEDEKLRPWTSDIERGYHQFVLDGGASDFITELKNNGEIAHQGETWNTCQDEDYLHDHLSDLYETEAQIYDALRDLQGHDVPQPVPCVKMPGFSLTDPKPVSELIGVSGILLQYIDGFPLTDISHYTQREQWQSICEEAIQILHRIGDRGVLNEDVQTRSFIVQKDKACSEKGYKVFMIDFALCNFRKDYADDNNWSESKAIQDEEGAIGLIMQDRLEGGFVYSRSNRYKKPAHYYE
ncbi:hypothetical protein N7481_001782 [Penicillium waksmanii]|uniref:uncharacterized protein n=1 Tax=Penicillium waksmanii TaxID=69791 RepID=UPI0025488EA9|nr:uncharacterized protein N7481_001782 [Penicillium waksmanii]KAJ5994805.1 hypothetical protein N7481_001782 [Penicillium waksmanii]